MLTWHWQHVRHIALEYKQCDFITLCDCLSTEHVPVGLVED